MAMEKEAIYNMMADEIAERFNVKRDTVTSDLNFLTDIDADSIDFVELVLEVEDMFNVEISDDDAENLVTLQQTVDYIVEHQN
ncbi:MAG: acyl carrier protein [Leuconostoc mesenteroides]|uniref:Acyl carrier protein n=1 Tax=Leuconostoc mesenteroides subsp. cremoris ATCC 19254 TaxID=586220 RepID=C2KL84_LEUMC|nr:acyl carrier protein [Leuconostoc mesenteroides]EQC84432.1 acyl carrier protein [Leuconostoc mesenteroides subsp. cremoris TIFN8]KDA52499.1 Acyl carrier protein [Leuconostoc mesenteroides subsp. cremoris T26]EEJ41991.1 putative acyl carrier protein [Leuconostoc mesenteroides subsp. cremoris ATCC 19254]MDG9749639.1 acyl carrier protein [Leuconostoc mesenteroides]ORI37715.1 acyl carrier protein [Leuconostoc mesenteroides subsp. cremoris]